MFRWEWPMAESGPFRCDDEGWIWTEIAFEVEEDE